MLIFAILAIVATISCVFLIDWYEGQQYVDFIAFAEINGGDWK